MKNVDFKSSGLNKITIIDNKNCNFFYYMSNVIMPSPLQRNRMSVTSPLQVNAGPT